MWVLHGGDHFTLLISANGKPLSDQAGATHELLHWNGLPPAGPRMATFALTAVGGVAGP